VNRSRRFVLVALVAVATLAGGCATVPTSDVNVINSRERLVIEFVSGFCNSSQGVPVQTVRLSGSVDHFLTPHVFATGTGTSFAVITQETRIYANPTAVVKLAVFPTSNSPTTTCSISLSGHLMGL
jgi:hypothetical protein